MADIDVIKRMPVPCWVRKAVLTISEQLNLVDVVVEIATLTVSEQLENKKGEKKDRGSCVLGWGENLSNHQMLS